MKMNRKQLMVVLMALADQDRKIQKEGQAKYYPKGTPPDDILSYEKAREEMLEFLQDQASVRR